MGSEQLVDGGGPRYVQMQSEPPTASMSSFFSFHHDAPEPTRIFDELPNATIISVSRPDAGDISPMLLSYTIECQYKQFKWRMLKKASHVFYLHFALKKRAFIEEIHEKQEQVKEWLQNLGIGDHTAVPQDEDGPDDEADPLHHDESSKNRDVPSSAALPIIHPALGRQQSMSDRAKNAMQGYLNHFLSNMDIVNSREVCRFLEVSKLSFSPEYGPKLKEDYVMVKHLPKIAKEDDARKCCLCLRFGCCNDNWQKVWAVLKPGFLALLGDPFDTQPMDIIVFDVLPTSDANGDGRVSLAKEIKERNPLRHSFKVTCGNRNIRIRAKNGSKVKDWVAAINDAGLRPPEGWCHPHRFGSYAPPRGLTEDGSKAQWFIDGLAAFEAISVSIERAKSEIFICGWWLCPELYLRRPFVSNASSRLDDLLEAKAKEGVQIYILLYKEVALALKINSVYSKRKLLGIHENVRVLRYPDHFSSGVYLWSHHEKLVIVDYHICFIGGLDLCFGRYDTPEHKVGDCPPSIWPGKDYYNPRESEPNSWEDTMRDELDRRKYPRMPWHDVHCALWGPPCRDIARHFVQRWNYAKRNKAPNEQAIPLLMPQHHMVIPHYLWNSRELEVEKKSFDNSRGTTIQDSFSRGSSFQDIPLLLPQEADGPDAENEGPKLNGLVPVGSPLDQPSKISSSLPFSFRKIKVEPIGSDMPLKGFVDDLDHLDSHGKSSGDGKTHHHVKSSEFEWWEKQDREHHGGFTDESGQVGPCASCRCQVIRSVSQWSAGTSRTEDSIHIAYCSLIEKAEHFIYIENQFFISGLAGDESIRNRVLEALYRRIMRAHREKKTFRVIVVIPLLPGFQGGLDDSGAASVRAIMHWQYRTICRGPNSMMHNLYDLLGSKVQEYISFYGLRSYGKLFDGGPVATSQVYVHSKIMIIDDCIALIGSANINDRSLLGSRDSEIAIVIEDNELINSYMGEQPWKAGKFCWSLRLFWSRLSETPISLYFLKNLSLHPHSFDFALRSMASGSAGRPNSAPKSFDFGSDNILCSFEDYTKQEPSNGSHSDPVSVANSSKDFHKSRMSTVFPGAAYGQPDDSINQDVIAAVENSMKKHSDNLLRFLEGISSRLSQLELYCYNLDKSVGEMRSDLARDHEEADSKLKSIEKHVQEVHRSVQIIRDKQELAETQKDLAKLQVPQKEPSLSSHSQTNEERVSTDPKKNENPSEIHNQQLALALPHQIVPQQNPITAPPSAALPQNVPQQQQSYYISSSQLPGQQPSHIQHAQNQYISSDSQHRASQPQDVSQMTNPQLSQTPQPFNQYQQQWAQPPSQPAQPPQQASMQPQIRPPPTSVYPSPYPPPNQPTSMPETLSSSMPMQMSFASIPQPGSSRADAVPYGYAAASGGSAPQQPPQVKNAYGPATGEGYMPPGQQPALSSGGAYMMYDRESGRPPHHLPQQPHHPSQQSHFSQSGYPPANAPHQVPPQAPTGPHVSARNPSHSHLIEKLVGMGFRGDHVASIIQRMEDSGQTVDFNAVLDRLSTPAGPGPQRAW